MVFDSVKKCTTDNCIEQEIMVLDSIIYIYIYIYIYILCICDTSSKCANESHQDCPTCYC